MRIFFNRGFSLVPIAQAMIAAVPELEIYIGIGPDTPRHSGTTQLWDEPNCADVDYVDWIRDRIFAHAIDLFVPTRARLLIASAKLPCRVHLPTTPATLALLHDKYAFAQAVRDEAFHLPTKVITSSRALERALSSGEMADPCVKPRSGVNGLGFWKLSAERATDHLDDPSWRRIRPAMYLAALRTQEEEGSKPDLVLMEFLPGPEVSFDVLAHRGKLLIYAGRTKLPNGNQRVQTRHPLAPSIASLVDKFGLDGVINLQFRRASDGTWKLLEINTRPAGGSSFAESVGAGILANWARLLTRRIVPGDVAQPNIDTEVTPRTFVEEVRREEAA